MKKTRIAVVQMQAKTGKVKENLRKIEQFVKEAATKNVDIICFPELCVQGYNREKARLTAEPIPGESALTISKLAQKANMVILVGMAEKSSSEKPLITQLVAFPNGKLGKYSKTHLGKSELPYFTPGHNLPVFSTDKAKFGIQICWDLHFPEVTAILSLKGSEIIFAPHASPVTVGNRRDIWKKYLLARAYDNSVFVAACNLIGYDGVGQSFCGGAMVIDPKGNVIAEAFNGKEELLVVDLDPATINTIRLQKAKSMSGTFYLQARRPELYGDLIKY
ncbi:nitrilase family protein [Calderihabitans maritimus]|uniref:Nitrilase/cyanide hydratase and apolipoprotein N-acyltransferase n=1 Tax=Calderihabitans maritimus TaxID=1246530 RepID=A0A1Z5HR29_9FIRM|nr:nitrilase family protein [Calderihabitans maritimus]GAW91771.1 nitrilase/cyanide hydratase and apolipoprotein N-acyltransferase [Calderihabitans maritimus]